MTTTIDAAAGPATGVNRFEALQKATPTFKPSRTGQQRALEAAICPTAPAWLVGSPSPARCAPSGSSCVP